MSARLIRDPKAAASNFEAEGIVQRGTVSTGLAATAPRQDVAAWFAHADLSYAFAGGWKPWVSFDFDYATGDRPGGGYGRFDPIYGMRRADLAPGAIQNLVLRSNLVSPGVRLEEVPSAKTDLRVSYRPFWQAAREDAFSSSGVRDALRRSDDFAGHQLDARLRYALSKSIRLEADVVLIAKGRLLREAPNAPPGRFTRYPSLNTTFLF
ncbi:MAG: alginate export family protein [Erythrobacter sp.]